MHQKLVLKSLKISTVYSVRTTCLIRIQHTIYVSIFHPTFNSIHEGTNDISIIRISHSLQKSNHSRHKQQRPKIHIMTLHDITSGKNLLDKNLKHIHRKKKSGKAETYCIFLLFTNRWFSPCPASISSHHGRRSWWTWWRNGNGNGLVVMTHQQHWINPTHVYFLNIFLVDLVFLFMTSLYINYRN